MRRILMEMTAWDDDDENDDGGLSSSDYVPILEWYTSIIIVDVQ